MYKLDKMHSTKTRRLFCIQQVEKKFAGAAPLPMPVSASGKRSTIAYQDG